MSEVDIVVHREVVGEVHDDEWSDDLRVVLDEWGPMEREMKESSLIDLIAARGYDMKGYGNSHYSTVIFDEYEKHVCQNCNCQAMYDSNLDCFYCPRCER